MNNKLRYRINCTCANGSAIADMVDNAREITWDTFIQHVEKQDLIDLFDYYYWRGYNKKKDTIDLKLSEDYAVSFWKSKYKERPCYYLEHSSIEYIFY